MSNERIIKERKQETFTEHVHHFDSKECPGAGFTFDVDADGNPIFKAEAGRINYERVTTGDLKDKYVDCGIEERSWKYWSPAVLKCYCGAHVTLSSEENDCQKCGQVWSQWGQAYKRRNDPTRFDDVDWAMEQEALDYERMGY